MNDICVTRRDSMITLGATAAGLMAWGALPSAITATETGPANADRKRVLRVAHLTDIHVEHGRRAAEGMAACLRHVQTLDGKPELIITGGDSVMDTLEADDARATELWDLWHSVLANECSLPVRSCIGNHDVWGWTKSKSKTTGDEPNWGKRRAVEMLKIDDRYYSFEQNGWRFIVLDSTQPLPDGREGYTAYLDEAQLGWLKGTLEVTPAGTPVMIVSHIPILSTTALLWAKNENGYFQVSNALMHTDVVKLKDLFAKHPNVKICASGHTHLDERVDYNGVSYLCDGAVSGNWWKGRHKDCDEGYAVIDLYDDGSFDREYVKYGWKASA